MDAKPDKRSSRSCQEVFASRKSLTERTPAVGIFARRLLPLGGRRRRPLAAALAHVFFPAKYAFSRLLLSAVTFHLNHLRIARALGDSAGEVRANSSLANDFLRLDDCRKALYYLVRNYTLAKKVSW